MTAITPTADEAVANTAELTSGDAAKLLRVSRTHVIRLVDSGQLTEVRRTPGGHLRISKAEVLKFESASKDRKKGGLGAMVRSSERLVPYDLELAGIPIRTKR